MTGADTLQSVLERLAKARASAAALRAATTEQKNQTLLEVASLLQKEESAVLEANQRDLARIGPEATPAFRDRLTLNFKRLEGMRESLRQVAALPDPLGEIVEKKTLPNGLLAQRVRSPLGVIFMIFESRPNVALEAFSLAFKSGNVIALRGGKESQETVAQFYAMMARALKAAALPEDVVVGITSSDRTIVNELLKRNDLIDVVVPRGGEGLIRAVVENSRIPIIKNDRGLCHVYVHVDADLDMALRIVKNAKTHRPGVCNAMETLLVHESQAEKFLPAVQRELTEVEIYGCPQTQKILPSVKPVTASSYDTEYLELKMNVRVVPSLEEAIAHIERHGSRHSESIVTAAKETFVRFRDGVDSAAVYWNASTRFTDGFELGLGGELGISTQKLHVRGPVGLKELTSVRWVIEGTGQVRS